MWTRIADFASRRGETMPFLYTRLTNSVFQTRDDGQEFNTPEMALACGVTAAMQVALDEFQKGKINTAVEICIEGFDEVPIRKSVVSVWVADLQVG